jgi:uncharacterized protein YndB with AHSA1/START domain
MKRNIYSMNYFQTSDLAIAAYLMMRGLKLFDASVQKGGRFMFKFEDPDGTAFQMSIEYVNSESAKFDAHIKNLKNILYKN